MSQRTELYFDGHRKVVIVRVSENSTVAIVDIVPYTLKKEEYYDKITFGDIFIARRRLDLEAECGKSNDYDYTIIEEVLCLKDRNECTAFSYIVHIVCKKDGECRDEEVVNLIKCVTSRP